MYPRPSQLDTASRNLESCPIAFRYSRVERSLSQIELYVWLLGVGLITIRFIKKNKFFTAKETINNTKRQSPEWEKIFAVMQPMRG